MSATRALQLGAAHICRPSQGDDEIRAYCLAHGEFCDDSRTCPAGQLAAAQVYSAMSAEIGRPVPVVVDAAINAAELEWCIERSAVPQRWFWAGQTDGSEVVADVLSSGPVGP